MLAPEATATSVLPLSLSPAMAAFMPAIDKAPAGSRIERVSSNTSLIAAQMASLLTRMISSTYSCASRKVSLPTFFTATPSAKMPTRGSVMRSPLHSERAIASASSGSTPTILISGRSRLI